MRSAPSTRRPVANGPWVRFTGKKVTEGTGGWVGGLGVLYMERLVLYMEFCCYIWKLLFTSGGEGVGGLERNTASNQTQCETHPRVGVGVAGLGS